VRTVERQRIEGLAVALLWQQRRAVRPGSAPVAVAGWAGSIGKEAGGGAAVC